MNPQYPVAPAPAVQQPMMMGQVSLPNIEKGGTNGILISFVVIICVVGCVVAAYFVVPSFKQVVDNLFFKTSNSDTEPNNEPTRNNGDVSTPSDTHASTRPSNEEPAVPEEPEEPTAPEEPEGPTAPVEPEEPTAPVEPEGPTAPVEPEEPTAPNLRRCRQRLISSRSSAASGRAGIKQLGAPRSREDMIALFEQSKTRIKNGEHIADVLEDVKQVSMAAFYQIRELLMNGTAYVDSGPVPLPPKGKDQKKIQDMSYEAMVVSQLSNGIRSDRGSVKDRHLKTLGPMLMGRELLETTRGTIGSGGGRDGIILRQLS